MAAHYSTLAWKIPWIEEPGRLQSMGSRRVTHDWVTSLSLFFLMHWKGNGNPLHCSCLENPRDGESGGLPSMGSHRVGHDWSDLVSKQGFQADSCLWSGTAHRAPDEQGLFTLHIGWTPGLDFYPSCPKTAPKSKAKLLRRQIPLDIPDFTFLKTELENHSSKISKTEWCSYLDWCFKASWSLKLPPCQLRF